ncbi:DnaJ domain-containing protein [Hydrogenophaga sp.]|uniref:DnaJ domain-containing protein n=1 Tax=Hydrogenophaga sp. TaxID=1904254 RepID=UPI00271803F3|nr:DnaJ domain-containing protein [Hydrogenophaga sp.]MDO9604890.1 DnaJ domain-containing protein [Hydrogenophaga sp.]
MSTAQPQAAEHQAVGAALLDFQDMPGRYPVALREPRPVFDQMHRVLMLAAGRSVDGLGTDTALEGRVRQAARFFVRSVLLRPGADHYTLLGVAPGVSAEVLREHYRLMIRLTHPDFLASGESWPADAAARINIANDVLSSPQRREAYHATRVPGQPPDSTEALVRALQSPLPLPQALRAAAAGRRKPVGRQAVAPAGVALAAVLLGILMWPSAEDGSLTVARPRTDPAVATRPAPLPAAPEAPQRPTSEQADARNRPDLPPPPQPPDVFVAQRPPAPAPVPVPPQAERAAAQAVTLLHPTAPQAHTERPVARAIQRAEQSAAAPRLPVRAPQPPVALVAAVRPSGPEVPLRDVMDVPPVEVAPLAVGHETAKVARLPAGTPLPQPPGERPPMERPVGSTPANPQGPVIHMGQVQPVLSNVTLALQSGRGEEALQWLERSSRNDAFAAQFSQKYHQALAGSRVTGLGQVRFTPRFAAEQLVVDGVVQLRLQDEKQQASVRDFHLRAYFRSQGGAPVLARLVAE